MLININSNIPFINLFFNLKLFYNYDFKQTNFNNIFRLKNNFFFYLKSNFFKKYYYFFKYYFKVNNYIFLKCSTIFFNKSLNKLINMVYSLSQINLNFYFLSRNFSFNLFWNIDVNILKKSFNKNLFIRFIINFFKINRIKILILLDNKFYSLLPFFKKFNLITAGLISFSLPPRFLDIPLFINNISYFNKFFFFTLIYKVFLLSLKNKYYNNVVKYIKYKRIRLL